MKHGDFISPIQILLKRTGKPNRRGIPMRRRWIRAPWNGVRSLRCATAILKLSSFTKPPNFNSKNTPYYSTNSGNRTEDMLSCFFVMENGVVTDDGMHDEHHRRSKSQDKFRNGYWCLLKHHDILVLGSAGAGRRGAKRGEYFAPLRPAPAGRFFDRAVPQNDDASSRHRWRDDASSFCGTQKNLWVLLLNIKY